MNTARKEQLLYQKAHGQAMDASPAEQRELCKYRVDTDNGYYATRANIRAYIRAVDSGYSLPFYDWCISNRKADRRRKGSSEREMASDSRDKSAAVMLVGWLTWGIALYWAAGQSLSVGTCAIAGAVLSLLLYHLNRRLAMFTLLILPAIVACIAAKIL